jgi:hypothetical protein
MHLQQITNAIETLEAKHQFESYARSQGITIRHYHADNGRFVESTWADDAKDKGQDMSYAGVGAHHQNGRAEKRIRDLQDLARFSLIHAIKRWPSTIDVRLWPYAIRKAAHALNYTLKLGKDKCPINIMSKAEVSPNPIHEHLIGCPVYVLDYRIQGGMKGEKWAYRSRPAIYLGNSTQYSRNVALVLSLTTGLVSPQFHAKYDDEFDTVTNPKKDKLPVSLYGRPSVIS